MQFAWGESLFESGEYTLAIMEWQSMSDFHGEVEVQANIAEAYRRLGNRLGELEALQQYYTVAPDEEAKTVAKRIRKLGGQPPIRRWRDVKKARKFAPSTTDAA